MGRFVNHEACPKCGSRNNLGRYDDGSAWCFGCHYHEPPTCAPGLARRTSRPMVGEKQEDSGRYVQIPDDAGTDYGGSCVEWLASYHTDLPTAIRNGLLWSPSRLQLIYQLGNVWQARNFNPASKTKAFTSGDVNECTFCYGLSSRDSDGGGSSMLSGSTSQVPDSSSDLHLVIVEDPLSALRIAPLCPSMPLLGSHLATRRLMAVAGLYKPRRITVWLDHDKLKEARGIIERFKMLGISARTIYTDLDPKCYTDTEIAAMLLERTE